jgi:hypothetical protein
VISPPVARPVVSTNRKAETPKLTDIHKKEDNSKKQEELIPDEDKRKNKFGIEEIQSALLKYCSDKNVSNTYLSLLKNEIKLPKEFEIEIQLKNSVEKKFLGEIEVQLTKYMRDALQNDFTMISSAFNQGTTVHTAYTNEEIFKEMLEKKPELLKLKEALGLDTEF